MRCWGNCQLTGGHPRHPLATGQVLYSLCRHGSGADTRIDATGIADSGQRSTLTLSSDRLSGL